MKLAVIPSSSSQQVAEAISAARRAFDGGEWSQLSGKDRSQLLLDLADLIERDQDDLLELVATEVGTPVRDGRQLHVELPVKFLRWFAEAARRGPRDGLEEALPLNQEPFMSSSILVRDPAGVVAAITAYNYPIILCAWKLGPTFASGCSAVLVPSPKAVLSTIAFVKLTEEAGFPPGALNMIFGSPRITQLVVSADEVDMITFTGSSAVGSKIMALAAPSLKRIVLELGGKSPLIVLPGADIEAMVEAAVLGFASNAGQQCGALTRTLVPQDRVDNYVEASSDFIRRMVVGDARRDETDVGPLISDEHLRDVEGYLGRATDAGASIAIGGGRPEGLNGGFFLQPTLVTGAANDAEINQDELFAPVGAVIPYRDLDEAVSIANRSRYALNANIWGPTADAIAVARRLRSGTVSINGGAGTMRVDAPWGGPAASGLGREGGEEGYREFFEVRHIQWRV